MPKHAQSTQSDLDPMSPISIPMEDDCLHSDTSPFCYDPCCFCHEEQTLIEQVLHHVQAGLFTPNEATNFVAGRTLWAAEGGMARE